MRAPRAALLLAPLLLAAAPAPIGPVVTMAVSDRPLRVRITPGAMSQLTCNPSIARRLQLATEPGQIDFGGTTKAVLQAWAPVRGDGAGGRTEWQWIGFTDRDTIAGSDCEVGPDRFADRVLSFALRAPQPGEQVATLSWQPGADRGLASYSYGELRLGAETLQIRFDPGAAESFATAAAARLIAEQQGGMLSGPARAAMIDFGVTRPVRTLRLSRPLTLGPLAIDQLPVRVRDWGSTVQIPDADRPEEEGGADDVRVTAKTRPRRLFLLRLGADWLARCSTISFDGPARVIRLSCV